MGLRDAFVRLLSRGSDVQLNPNEPVELTTVPHHEGPLIVAELRNGGVAADAVDSYNLVTRTLTDARIMVRRGDFDAAERVLAERFSHEIH